MRITWLLNHVVDKIMRIDTGLLNRVVGENILVIEPQRLRFVFCLATLGPCGREYLGN